MSKAHVISKFRFLECGKAPPKGSRFKGTISTASLLDWYEYTGREKAADRKKERGMHEGGLLGYTSQDDTTRTFSSDGWLTKDKMPGFKKKIAKAFHKDGDICWDTVVSLKDYQDSFQSNMNDVNDYAAIVSKSLPGYFKSIGLDPDNMIWWMNYHNNKKNPHMHIVFMEKVHTRTRGKLAQKYLDKYKSTWLKELGLRQEFTKRYGKAPKDVFREKDALRKTLISGLDMRFHDQLLHSFYTTIPKKGRLSYNSKNMKPYRRQLNLIIRSLLQDEEIRPTYEEWLGKVEMLDDLQNTLANEKISHFKKTELDKLYTRIGNMILGHAKYKETECKQGYDLWFSKQNIRYQDEQIYRIKLQDRAACIDLPSDAALFLDERGFYHVEIEQDKSYTLHRYAKNLDAWKDISETDTLQIDRDTLFRYMHAKDISLSEGEPKIFVGQDSRISLMDGTDETAVPLLTDDPKEIPPDPQKSLHARSEDPPVRMGMRKRSKVIHKQKLSAVLKKGSKRILHQDAQEKERDLERFIREYEEQQIRSEERGKEYI
ncbi:MobP3 family relaxase [[Clostridium] innocuum]|uniref:MobP3 family relaxase n=1 Tax=Clostridium innocuum TaxID=1522 RepID=UPI0018999FEB|nr:MobP3 family relaxase [[Clostridium] innocuum]